MRQQRCAGILPRPLPQRRAVNRQTFADAALGILDLAIDLVCGYVDEAGRDVGDQPFETQVFFQFT